MGKHNYCPCGRNDGEAHRRKYHGGKSRPGGGANTHRWILKHPKQAQRKLQLLCANCHQLKSTYGFVPLPECFDELDEPEHLRLTSTRRLMVSISLTSWSTCSGVGFQ